MSSGIKRQQFQAGLRERVTQRRRGHPDDLDGGIYRARLQAGQGRRERRVRYLIVTPRLQPVRGQHGVQRGAYRRTLGAKCDGFAFQVLHGPQGRVVTDHDMDEFGV